MPVELTWLGHASFRIAGERVVYIDPWKLTESPRDGDVVIVSHEHYDHLNADDIAKVLRPGGELLGSMAAIEQLGQGHAASPGDEVTLCGVNIETLPAYNPAKQFHPPALGGLGVIVTLDGVRIYYAGDTDVIPEMGHVRNIDLSLLPVGGTYTMNAAEAAQACEMIKPAKAIPYHFGDIVGTAADAEAFAKAAACPVEVLQPGQTTTIG